jgi:hypothetical protein
MEDDSKYSKQKKSHDLDMSSDCGDEHTAVMINWTRIDSLTYLYYI